MTKPASRPPLNVWMMTAEMAPFARTGGLGEVLGSLPPALGRLGVDVTVVLPRYGWISGGREVDRFPLEVGDFAQDAGVFEQRIDDRVRALFIDCPALYRRDTLYGPNGQDYPDNPRRFAFLVRAAFEHAIRDGVVPSIVHAHDWHAALAPAYLHHARRGHGRAHVGCVFTVHNLAFQGVFPAHTFAELGLPKAAFHIDGLEFHGGVSFLKAGVQYADRITTVSPTYAQEIQTPEQGCGLDGLLRKRRHVLSGILNGVDRAVWDPASDRAIAQTFDARTLPHKAANKAALQQQLGLAARADALLFGIVSRFTEQKGLHLVLAALPELLRRGGQLVALGSGEPALETAFRHAAHEHPRSVAVHIGFDEALSHRVFAGTDVTLVPSRFEPCGLTQMYGLAYGSLPLVHRVGGLADTVVDAALENLADGSTTGFVFDRYDATAYGAALRRAFALHARRLQWRRVQRTAMQQVFDWGVAAASYLALYRTLLHPTHDHAVA
jgi:starch synthase